MKPTVAPRRNGRAAAPTAVMAHHLTVDVEEYFHVTAFRGRVAPSQWPSLESRVDRSVALLLDALDEHHSTATFFVLGWLADHKPDLVRTIHGRGHEIASHGWDHRLVTEQTPAEFRTSVRQTRERLEDITGEAVIGFRAPSFSIVPGFEWALDVLLEEGYRYDSSLFPILRRGYGYPDGSRDPVWIARPSGRLAEFPPSTLRLLGVNVPAAGGAYFRLFPYTVTRSAFERLERRGVPGTFYIHPWELDPDQPRIPVSWPTRIRHYFGLDRTLDRLHRLMGEFRFRSIARTLSAR